MSEQTLGEESSNENGLCQYAQKITACFGGMGKTISKWWKREQYVVQYGYDNDNVPCG